MSNTTSNRRGFLRTSTAVLAAGATAPYFWSSRSAAAESKNDRPNVAAIGTGGGTVATTVVSGPVGAGST